jgi:hypothetical protein
MSLIGGDKKGPLFPSRKLKHRHKFGDERFDFIRACKHDLKNGSPDYISCPLCKLVHNVTKSYFDFEREKQWKSKEESKMKRAFMRRKLLIEWSRCQAILYVDTFPTDNADIFISKSMVKF